MAFASGKLLIFLVLSTLFECKSGLDSFNYFHDGQPSTASSFAGNFFLAKYPDYTNSTNVYNILLLQAGDIETNPGDAVKCPICSRTIAVNHRSVVCGTCRSSYHIKCGNVLAKQHRDMASRNWTRNTCIHSSLSFTGLSKDSFHALYNEGDASTLNISTSSQSPVDWYNENINSYFKGNLKIGHLNVNSIYGKADEILDLLNVRCFDILFIGENKIDSTVSSSLFSHPLYRIVRRDRKKGAGGMLAYICSTKI